MGILSRHIASRFLWNFAALFGALYLFGVGIDVVISTNKFLEAADLAVREGRAGSRLVGFVIMLLDFHGPRVFQFFQFMVGMVAVGAMGFTFSQMHRARELTAIMAAGVDLRRIAAVVVVAALGLNVLQLGCQELILPRIAPRLVRTHSDMVEGRGSTFPVPLTRDASGKLLQAASFDPVSGRIDGLIVLERDERGRARNRISATTARWDAVREVWVLEGGKAIRLPDAPQSRVSGDAGEFERPADEVATSLGPESILTRRFRIYGQMLSTPQLLELRDGGGPDRTLAGRLLAARVLGPIVNLLVLIATIPYFLLREPRGMLGQSLRAAAFAVPVSITALTLTTVPISGMPPLLGAAIPAALLMPWAAWRLSALRS